MRRVTRLRQPRLLLSSTPAPAQHAICVRGLSTTAPRREDAPKRNRLREALWRGPAPGPEDPYAQPAPNVVSEEQRELEAYEAEQAELEASKYDFGPSEPKNPRPVSRLKVNFKRTVAPRDNEATGGYTPAINMEGLEEVGGYEGWWDREGHWGPESVYVPYATTARVENADALEVMLRQAVVEALAVRQGEDAEEGLMRAWAAPHQEVTNRALKLKVAVREDGGAEVSGEALEKIRPGLFRDSARYSKKVAVARAAGEPIVASEPALFVAPEKARELVESFDDAWKEVSLADPRLKFAINKRVFQLTGVRIHDAKLAQAETVGQMLSILVRPEPPKKIYDILEKSGELELPNVAVHSRRYTPIDREKSVGRWKLIVEQLEKRNLPVTGHEHLEKHHEMRWERGGT